MSGGGNLKTDKRREQEDNDYERKLEDHSILRDISRKLDIIIQFLEEIMGER